MISNRRPLKIVMLTTVRFHHSKGGTEKVMIETANAFVNRGHEVTIIFRDKDGSSPGFSLDKKVKLVNCSGVKTPIWYSSLINDLRSVSLTKEATKRKKTLLNLKTVAHRYREAINNTAADIYITYDPKMSALLVKEFNINKPIITTFQFAPEHIIKRYYFETLKDLIGQAGPIQVLLPEFVNTIHSVIPNANCVAIPNAVNPVAEKAELREPTVINVGRVTVLKNQELIVSAFKLIHKQFPNWKVKIIGEYDVDVDYYLRLKKSIKENELENVVEFCGPSDDVKKELLKASIFVFPSTSEGFGLALTEAMAVGLPSIGLKSCVAVSHLINDTVNGLLCENSPQSLAQALTKLITDQDLRNNLGKKAREDVQNFSSNKIWDRWEELLYSLV